MKQTIVYHSPAMQSLAHRIVSRSPETMRLGNISWSSFSDGWPNISIGDKSDIRESDVVMLASLENPADFIPQWSLISALPSFECKTLRVILPDFPTGTMERLDADENGQEVGKIATAKTLARMLSNIPLVGNGRPVIVIYDIHALQEKFYFSDGVIPRLMSAMPVFREATPVCSDVVIAFPDEGAEKRFSRMFGGYEKIICSKIRNGSERIVRIESGDPRGKHVIIVDDRVLSGGTLHATKDILLKAGALEVSADVTHGVFPDDSWKTFLNAGFSKFRITDSCPTMAAKLNGIGPFEVLTLANSIGKEIRGEA